MKDNIIFNFRNTLYCCKSFIDSSKTPYLVFIILLDKVLIEIFGDEVTIKTDFETSLPHKHDFASLLELKEAIFSALIVIPEFKCIKQKMFYMEAL